MPFSVRQIALDDKLCHHVSLEVVQDVYPLETVEQVLSDCHAWEKREKALTMVAIVYLVIALIGRDRPAAVVSARLAPVGHPEHQGSLLPGPTRGSHRWDLRGCRR